MSSETTVPAAPASEPTLESLIDLAKRAFALKNYEEAVDHYATALELVTTQAGDDAPETADLYFAYGKALLENAISQSSVLGKEQAENEGEEDNKASGSGTAGNAPILSFSGDAEDDDTAVDMFAEAEAAGAAEDGAEEEEGDEDAEPEDDFNAAWEVLDLARALFLKQVESGGDEQVKLKLADTYITLGDVSLETEKFDQAITDYEEGLKHKHLLLPLSSRQIAEAHYKLSIVLDLTSGRLADAIVHAEKALESIEARLTALSAALENPPIHGAPVDIKGKGKATATPTDDELSVLSPAQISSEIKDLTDLKGDLALKVEELKTSPNDSLGGSAPALAAQALEKELNGNGSSGISTNVVNDLTSIVKKKKKAPEESSSTKRKAEDDGEGSGSEKKPKIDTSGS